MSAPHTAPDGHALGGAGADPVVEYLLRLGDDRLVLGHRLSEWCGHAPILEEDIALGNVALDLLGQAQALLRLAGAREGRGRDEDALAYWRDAREFRNVRLAELPRGDFAHTVVRQFLFDAFDVLLTERLAGSADADVAGVMAKAHKEARYHVRHSGDWVQDTSRHVGRRSISPQELLEPSTQLQLDPIATAQAQSSEWKEEISGRGR